MMTSHNDDSPFAELAAVLDRLDRPGSFCGQGRQVTPLPLIEVEGFGPLPLPVIPQVVELLRPHAEPAPYGRGGETLIDPSVRRCLQLGAGRVRLSDRHWADTLVEITGAAAAALGADGDVEARLYKLLVYEAGDFFVPHRDTEKEAGMFATLVVVLPSTFEGGELVVTHHEEQEVLDLASTSVAELSWGAFYADCTHEVRPLTSGVRVVLVYNLVRKQGDIRPPEHQREIGQIRDQLGAWIEEGAPAKLCAVLDHHYTSAELSWNALKGSDRITAMSLRRAAESLRLDVFLAMVSIEESWSATEIYHGRRYGGYRWEEPDPEPEDIELYELFEQDRRVEAWRDTNDEPTDAPSLPFEDEELCPPGALTDEEPDEFHYHEATGNEGATVERTYRRAAVVIWPPGHRVRVLAQAGPEAVAHALEEQAQSAEPDESLCRALAVEGVRWLVLSRHLWQAHVRIVTAMTSLGLRDGVVAYLRDCGGRVGIPVQVAQHLPDALDLLDAAEAAELLEDVVEVHGLPAVAATAAILDHASSASVLPGSTWLVALERTLDLLDRDVRPDPNRRAYHRKVVIEGVQLAALLRTGLRMPTPESADQLLALALARPERFPFDSGILPAVLEVAEGPLVRVAGAGAWLQHCAGVLSERLAIPLRAPADLKRDPPEKCSCEHCSRLADFLRDPVRSVWDYAVREDLRRHVVGTIQREGLEVATATIREGSPYKLRLKKTTARYDAALKQRRRETAALATVQSAIEDRST